ncbi:MAG TPA: hypothetical protein PL048_22495, partial [Leptospiraceae bacterium]|nr:hypothetical protein [Leptospiraceae bacterium]
MFCYFKSNYKTFLKSVMLKIGRISARFHISFRSFLILFFIFQVLMLPEAEAQLKQEMNWDTDSSSA